jgi:hypothetical protein
MNRTSKNHFNLYQLTHIAFITSLFIATSSAYAITYQKPIVVDDAYIVHNGNIITGNYLGNNKEPAITITTSKSVTINNSNLAGPGDLIQAIVKPASITVLNTTGIGINPSIRGKQKGIFLHVKKFTSINMQNNNIQGMRIGFYSNGYSGDHTMSQTLVISRNVFTNIDARPSDGKGDYETTGQYNGQAIHLGNITHVPAIDIGWNKIINTAYESSTGALIEVNESSGTSGNLMQIHDNYIQGAFPSYPGYDLYDFGGILINGRATDTTDTASSFINIVRNRVVATANYGISIVAGHDIVVNNNRIISSGFLANNKLYTMSSYGNPFGVANINYFNQPATVFYNNNIEGNVLGLIRNDGHNNPVRADWSLPGQSGAIEGNTSFQPNACTSPSLTDEEQELINWQQSLRKNAIAVGVS